MKNYSFSKKLIIVLSLVVIIVIGSLSLLIYNHTSNLVKNMANAELEKVTDGTYNLIDSTVQSSIKNYLRAIAETQLSLCNYYYGLVEQGRMTEAEAKKALSKEVLSHTVGTSGYTYFLDSNGIIKVHPKEGVLGADLTKYEFIQQQIKKKDGYIEYMWKNPDDEKERPKALYMTYFEPWDYIISVSSYKEEFNELITVEDFNNQILGILIGETGYTYVMDNAGRLIIHPEMTGENISESTDASGNYFIKEMLEKKNGVITYPWKNPNDPKARDKVVVYRYYEPLNWIIASGTYIEEMYKPLELLRVKILITAAIMLVLGLIVSVAWGKKISRTFNEVDSVFDNLSRGDLSERIEISSKDEIGHISATFNDFLDEFTHIIRKLKNRSEQVNHDSDVLNELIVSFTHSFDEIVNIMEEILEAFNMNMERVEEINGKIDEISASSRIVSDSVVEVTDASSSTNRFIIESQDVIEDTVQSMKKLKRESNLSKESIESLAEFSIEINEMISGIIGIAEQTNLLALNASIEAARAGEAGKGFSVVASEIGKLAEESREIANEVTEVINKIHENIDVASDRIHSSMDSVQAGENSLIKTTKVFKKMEADTNKISEKMAVIKEDIMNQEDNIVKIADYMTVILDKTNDNIKYLGRIEKEIEAKDNDIEKMEKEANELKEIASSLREVISDFKVKQL